MYLVAIQCTVPILSELAGSSGSEMRQRINHASSERDSALQQAQELADRLDLAERDRDHLQLTLEASQAEVDELTYQMEDLRARYTCCHDYS